LKAGLSIGGALVAQILSTYGYAPEQAVQSAATVHGIKLAVSVYCSIPFLLGVALLFLYKIDKRAETHIEQELAARRVQAAAA
jgi:Na+/melibiose symporter-like transporter